jgi:alkanesulfonate monooxygenase SsuD/methylene tetrahydromethanopterin reductase-like flavin-dependent oxidoreductase (luciferase family)
VNQIADAYGIPRLVFEHMADYIGVMRRLWRSESVTHDGASGRFD